MTVQSGNYENQVAILIDFENTGLNYIQWLLDQASDVGRIIVKRAYADWSNSANLKAKDKLLEFGIDPIHLFRSSKGGKNSSDIRLAIDAVELLYNSPVDTFVVVSSDSDFVPLISRLRAAGKTVIGAGEYSKAILSLVKSCDRYWYIDQDKKSNPQYVKNSDRDTDSLIKRAVEASADETGKVVGSKLHQTMLRLDPSFNYRSEGYSTFTKYLVDALKSSLELKLIPPKKKGDVIIELIETIK